MRAKKNINFLFCVHITFLFFILSTFHSPCLSSLPLHLFFLPPQTLLSIADLTSPAATDSFYRRSHKPSHHRSFRFALHSFCFDQEGPSHAVGSKIGRSVSVRAWFVSEDCETVPLGVGLICRYWNEQAIGHGFWFGCVDFSGFLFCSSSLVLMGTVGLWLCSDFYGFDGGCGCVLVVE